MTGVIGEDKSAKAGWKENNEMSSLEHSIRG